MVAPQPAGDHFVDSVAPTTTKTATLYYVETGKEDMTAGIDETKTAG